MTLYEHRLARLIERRADEAAGRVLERLDGMTYRQHRAAHGFYYEPRMSATQRNRIRARARAERDQHADPTAHP